MSDPSLDQLVDTIAARVKARLASGGAGGASGLPASLPVVDQPCDDNPASCTGCGHCVVRRPIAARSVTSAGAARVGAGIDTGEVPSDMAGMIDHTLLKPEATNDDIKRMCDEARRYRFASVCVNSANAARVSSLLHGSGVMTCAVVGFPLGAMTTSAKAYEAREAVRAGADEIDMVINVGAMKSRDYASVGEDIRRVVEASRPAKVKVILEVGLLDHEEKVIGIALSKQAGAAFVKTSTGFGPGGATVEDVAMMRKLVGNELGVKASGGVRTREDVEKMRAAGANRIGASASVSIVTGTSQAKSSSGKSGGGKSRGSSPGAY